MRGRKKIKRRGRKKKNCIWIFFSLYWGFVFVVKMSSPNDKELLTKLEMRKLERSLQFIGHKSVLMCKMNSSEDESQNAVYRIALERCTNAHRKFLVNIEKKIAKCKC